MLNKIKNATHSIYNTNKKILFISAFLIIIFLSLFPRSIEVLNQNPIFGFDQGREYLAARNIVVNHKLILIGTELGAGSAGISGLFHGPIYYYLLTIPFILFNGNPAGGTWLMLFFGLSSILFGYYLGKKIFNNYIGILIAFLMSISPILIAQSRFLWSPNPPTLFILLSFYFTYLLSQNKKNLSIFLAAFFAGFVYNFEMAVAIPLSLTLFIYSIYILRKQFNKYLYLILGYLLAFSPMIFFEVRHGFMGLKGIINYLTHPGKNSNLFDITSLTGHANSFLYNFKDTFPVFNYEMGMLLLIAFLVIAFYLTRKEKNAKLKVFIYYLLCLVPISFFVFSFLRNYVYNYYLIHLSLSYIIVFAYLIYASFKQKKNAILVGLIVVIVIITVFGVISAVKTSVFDYSDYGGTAKLKGQMAAIDYIYNDAKGKPFGVLVFAPPVYTYPYDYLLWWYGNKKYNYIPYSEKKGTFYLLIEKDPAKPWSYRGWLETVIKSGKIIYTKTLPSGFIIQKRVEK